MTTKPYNNSAKPTALSPQGGTAVLGSTLKRAVIFVDGSNWYHKLRKLLNVNTVAGGAETKPPVDFDLRGFAQNLIAPDTLVEIRYYIGKVRRVKGDAKSEAMYANQQRLIGFLQQQKVTIGFGHLINYPDGSFHEKGVDILLAVEMIRLVLEKKYDVAYLVSSDTDLVPAVDECKRLGGEVVYVGSSLHGQSFGLTKVCKKTILLQPKDVLPYVPPKLP
ncbi:MAG: hypothetical protein Greene041619_698 [Candidatus Peregrinibacteria bacterium Greene0416_19]|nr:MAG: hypothetical protein Greene041619_698 [Candidatus Peregrinibacteria bacterium Greene0416_19]